MQKRNAYLALAGLLLVAGLLATVGAGGASGESRRPARIALVNSPCKPDNAPAYLAESGALVATPLEEAAFASGTDASVLINDFDVAVVGRAYFYAVNAERPGDLVAFAASVNDKARPDYAVIVQKSSPVKDWRSLSGKVLGLEPASGYAKNVLSRILLEKRGLSSAVKVRQANVEELGKGVDALYLREPQLALALASGKYREIDTNMLVNGILDPWPQAYYVVTKRFLEKDPQAARTAVRAALEGVSKAQSGSIAAAALSRCAEVEYGSGLPIQPSRYWGPDDFDFAAIQKQVDLYVETGLVSKTFDARTILLSAAQR